MTDVVADSLGRPEQAADLGRPGGLGEPQPAAGLRHPQDPEPVRSTKAAAVLALGVAAVVTGPLVGGLIPAAVGFALARQTRGDLVAARGYLTGDRHLRIGVTLLWIGVGLAAAALVAASVIGLISLAGSPRHDFPDTIN